MQSSVALGLSPWTVDSLGDVKILLLLPQRDWPAVIFETMTLFQEIFLFFKFWWTRPISIMNEIITLSISLRLYPVYCRYPTRLFYSVKFLPKINSSGCFRWQFGVKMVNRCAVANGLRTLSRVFCKILSIVSQLFSCCKILSSLLGVP